LRDVAGFKFLADVACLDAEILEAASERIHLFVLLSMRQERMFPIDFFSGGDDMGILGGRSTLLKFRGISC